MLPPWWERTVKLYDRLDVAVNSAGCNSAKAPLAEQEAAEYDRVMGIDARGVFLCMKYEIAAMLASDGGSVVNVTSVAELIADPNASTDEIASVALFLGSDMASFINGAVISADAGQTAH